MLQGAQSTSGGVSGRRLLTSSAVRGYFNIYASASSKAKPPPPSPFPSPPPVPVPSPIVIGSIIWNDEFPVNTTLNSSYWTYQVSLRCALVDGFRTSDKFLGHSGQCCVSCQHHLQLIMLDVPGEACRKERIVDPFPFLKDVTFLVHV